MSADTKKEEFKKYLERCGVLDTLTKVLVELYEEPEKPGNALEFLRNQIGGGVGQSGDDSGDTESLKSMISELQQQLAQLTAENEALKAQLEEAQRAGQTQDATGDTPQ